MIIAALSGISGKEKAICWRSASEYDLYTRTSSTPANSKPARSLVEMLRDLFRRGRPQVEQADVVVFKARAATRTDKEVDREASKAA